MDDPIRDEVPGRLPVVTIGVLFEAGLGGLAWLLGRAIGLAPGETLRLDLGGGAVGVAATVPLLLVFLGCLKSSLPPLIRIRRIVDERVGPLFASCSLAELGLLAVSAGVGEELLFRGLIQETLASRLGPWPGLILASIAFGLVHPITATYGLIVGLIGLYLGAIWMATGNLLVPIVAHALYDFLALAYYAHGRAKVRGLEPIPGEGGMMADRPEATVRPVEESEATGRVAAVYADIKATKRIDFVPRFWKVLATSPDLLEATWARLKSVMHPEATGRSSQLNPLTREMIALAVSATNGCTYCVNSHTAAVRKLGLDAEGLGELMAVVALFNTTNSLADGYQVEPDVFPPRD